MLATCLQQAATELEGRNFDSAKQQLMLALRIDAHNKKARELSRELQKAVELERCRQQVTALRSQAEEASKKKQFAAALKYVQQALDLDRNNSDLLRFRDAVNQAQQRAASFNDGISRAHAALQRGNLDEARQAVEQALAIEPDDITAKEVASKITRQRELQVRQEQARQADAVKRTKQSILAANAVEKAMADARMLLFLNDSREAEAALDMVTAELSLVPPELRVQVEKLRRDIRQKLGVPSPDDPLPKTVAYGSSPAPADSATLMGQSDLQEVGNRPARQPEAPPPSPPAKDRREPLEELLEPRKTRRWAWSRQSWSWLAPTVIILIVGVFSIFLFKTKNPSRSAVPAAQESSAAAAPSYAEINAEPWGTVRQVYSLSDKRVLEVNEATPLRVKLPAGQYEARVEGPNGETETIRLEVPQEGGKSYFVLFENPDIQKILASP